MTQTEALKLAEYWETRAKDLQTWVDENDYVEFGYRPEGLKREQADQRRTAAELRRLHEVNQELLGTLQTILNVSLMDKGHWAKTVEQEAHTAITKAEKNQ